MELRRAFANEIESRQRVGGDLHDSGGFASKAAGEAARLAGLMQLGDLAGSGRLWEAGSIKIPPRIWLLAERSQRSHLAESLRVLSLSMEDSSVRIARRVLDWAARDPGDRRLLAGKDLVAARIAERVEEAEQTLTWLEERRWCRRVATAPGQRAQRWEIHPLALKGPKG
jgi:hypothetical protein